MHPFLRLSLGLALPAAMTAGPALAELRVGYVDSAPDLFTIANGSACDLGPFELTIDLRPSAAGLIFDVSGAGAGFSGYAPLSVVHGGEHVLSVSELTDGDARLVLEIDFLPGNGTISIAVDLDDTSPASELGRTIISPAEIAGSVAEVRRGPGAPPLSASFGADAVAVVPLEACIA